MIRVISSPSSSTTGFAFTCDLSSGTIGHRRAMLSTQALEQVDDHRLRPLPRCRADPRRRRSASPPRSSPPSTTMRHRLRVAGRQFAGLDRGADRRPALTPIPSSVAASRHPSQPSTVRLWPRPIRRSSSSVSAARRYALATLERGASNGLEAGGHLGRHPFDRPPLARFLDRPEEVELGREVVVERAPAHARALEDLLGRDPVVVALDEERHGRPSTAPPAPPRWAAPGLVRTRLHRSPRILPTNSL